MSSSQANTPKRAYLANITTIPPIIYPFQYNPSEINDSKSVKFRKATPVSQLNQDPGRNSIDKVTHLSRFKSFLSIAGQIAPARQAMSMLASKADLKEFKSEEERTLTLKFSIDGRERRPGEPARRRLDSGSILPDLAILRSFMYPAPTGLTDLAGAISGGVSWDDAYFHAPPTAVLVWGGRSMEGFVTDLDITETMFNADLDPIRADIEMTLVENIDSFSFIFDTGYRLALLTAETAWEDLDQVL